MKKALLLTLITSLSSFAWAERFEDHIHSVSEGKNGEEHLLMLGSGRVVFVDQDLSPYYRPKDFEAGERVELEVDEELRLKSITSLPPLEVSTEEDVLTGPDINQGPTVLPDYATAERIFNGMNDSYKEETECTDRAHVWSYEEWKKHKLIGKKVFMFFTDTYIRRYRHNWWFHVSPYTYVQENGRVVERVMDYKYIEAPFDMKSWSDYFIRSGKACPEKTYRYYRANKNSSEHCYLVKTAMYYRLPYHVRMMEDRGIIKNQFSSSEVNFSYRAFTRRGAK